MANKENTNVCDRANDFVRCFLDYCLHKTALKSPRLKRLGVWPEGLQLPESTPSKPNDFDLMRMTIAIETLLNQGDVKLLCNALEKSGVSFGCTEPGEAWPADYFELCLRTEIAQDKLFFYNMGLFKPSKRKEADLRTGTFVTNEREQIYAYAKMNKARQNTNYISWVRAEAGNMDADFFMKLGKILKRPGKKSEEFMGTRLQCFLIDYWVVSPCNYKGQQMPPLCVCSDPVIAALANFGLKTNVNTPINVRAVWQRLGLKKSKVIECWHVEASHRKLTFSQLRRGMK